jgi:hypothetical protein
LFDGLDVLSEVVVGGFSSSLTVPFSRRFPLSEETIAEEASIMLPALIRILYWSRNTLKLIE